MHHTRLLRALSISVVHGMVWEALGSVLCYAHRT